MKLHYQKIGKSEKILLAFHGMGQDFSCFQNFPETFDNQYTTYLFDLPFHGKSEMEEMIITKEIWKEYLDEFLQENQIKIFSIISFSMGGRFALATVEAFSERIENAFLLAPDGITENAFYFGVTRFSFTRKIFKKMLKNNQNFYGFVGFLIRIGILNGSVVKFVKIMLDTPEQQNQLYKSWVGFRYLRFDIKKIAQLINNQGIKIQLFMGKYDKLLPIQNVYPLIKHVKSAELIMIEATHGRLVEKTILYLIDNLPQKRN